jgi:hypothetical protein
MQQTIFTVFLTTALLIAAATINVAWASTLEKETGPLNLSGSQIPMNQTNDALDIDISIDPMEDITALNGTQQISTEGATDIDINAIPTEGVSVIIQNQTITVTENQVSVAQPSAEQRAQNAANPEAVREGLDLADIQEQAEEGN